MHCTPPTSSPVSAYKGKPHTRYTVLKLVDRQTFVSKLLILNRLKSEPAPSLLEQILHSRRHLHQQLISLLLVLATRAKINILIQMISIMIMFLTKTLPRRFALITFEKDSKPHALPSNSQSTNSSAVYVLHNWAFDDTERHISPKPKNCSKIVSYPQHVTINHYYNSPPEPFNDVSYQ